MIRLLLIGALLVSIRSLAQDSPVHWKLTAKKLSDKVYAIHLTATVKNQIRRTYVFENVFSKHCWACAFVFICLTTENGCLMEWQLSDSWRQYFGELEESNGYQSIF